MEKRKIKNDDRTIKFVGERIFQGILQLRFHKKWQKNFVPLINGNTIAPARTMMEVFDMLPEGTLAELIDNRLYMSPAPFFNHQKTVKVICRQLDILIEDSGRGTVILARSM